jgi:hypothetical protein
MKIALNHVLFLQTRMENLYMKRHNLTPEQFLEQDREHGILRLLEIGYELFHLTGDEGILDELDEIVAERRDAKTARNQA